MLDTYNTISRGTIHPTAKAGGLSLPLDPTNRKYFQLVACVCDVKYQETNCPKKRLKLQISPNCWRYKS